jgi:NTP pyrophosphatase (non-canonical NTP hydrolase)
MTLNEYQQKAMSTCMDSCDNYSYMMLNLVGEVGEFASKVAKAIRSEKIKIKESDISISLDDLEELLPLDEQLKLEAGDIAWQLAGLCKVMGWTLEEVCQANLDKLAKRKQAGTIDGNGDGINR